MLSSPAVWQNILQIMRSLVIQARRAAGLPPSVPEGGPAESDAHPAAAQSEPASAPDDAGTHPAAEPAASGANGITAFEEPQHPDNRCSRLPGAGVAADHCKRIERQPRQPDSQPQASAAGQTAEQRAPHSRNLQPAAGSSVAQQNSNKDARPAGSGPSACLPSTDGIVPTATKLNDWLPTQQVSLCSPHGMPAPASHWLFESLSLHLALLPCCHL